MYNHSAQIIGNNNYIFSEFMNQKVTIPTKFNDIIEIKDFHLQLKEAIFYTKIINKGHYFISFRFIQIVYISL